MSDWHISEEPAQAFIQRAICKCGSEMQAIGPWLLTSPPKMPHKCPACGNTVNLGAHYPTVAHRPALTQKEIERIREEAYQWGFSDGHDDMSYAMERQGDE